MRFLVRILKKGHELNPKDRASVGELVEGFKRLLGLSNG